MIYPPKPADKKNNSPARLFLTLLTLLFFFFGCSGPSEKIPDVSNIKINMQTWRFDKDLYAIDTNHIAAGLQQLKAKYPGFLDYYLDTIRAYGIHGNFNDTVTGIRSELKVDLTYKDFTQLQAAIIKEFPDKSETDKQLEDGFRLLKYYIPSYEIPSIYYLNMGLTQWPTFPVDKSTLCIGLDMFLGDKFPHYKDRGIPGYMAAHCRKSYLPVSLFNTVYQTLHPFNQEDKTLLDLMIQRGKEQYFLHKVLPHLPDSVLFGFTQVQLKWCSENEGLAYNFFIHQKLLFSKEGHSITPYVYDGPFAKDLESPADPVKYTPGNIGTWLGYRIVCAWMAQNPKTTLEKLLNNPVDPPRFLEEAQYRPK